MGTSASANITPALVQDMAAWVSGFGEPLLDHDPDQEEK
jgi:hypothetical protein